MAPCPLSRHVPVSHPRGSVATDKFLPSRRHVQIRLPDHALIWPARAELLHRASGLLRICLRHCRQRGILLLHSDDRMTNLSAWDASGRFQSRREQMETSYLCVDFKMHSDNILYAGTCHRKLKIFDLRNPSAQTPWITREHRGTTYVKSVSERHHILAASPYGSMNVYDLRFLQADRKSIANMPLVHFPEYDNPTRENLGIDVLPDPGVVAAAEQADRSVGMFSLRTGARLPCKAS